MALQKWFTSTAAPTTTPANVGDINIDTTNDRIYISVDTSSSSDWQLMPYKLSEITIDADLNLQGTQKLINALGLDLQASTELTISTGAITQTQSWHTIDTEGAAATDDLDTITIATDINVLFIRLANNARVVTLKHGTGNLSLPSSTDVTMISNTVYILIYDGSNWNLVNDTASAGSTLPVTDATAIVKGSIDDTKKMRLEVDTNVTASTTRILTMRDADLDLTDVVTGPATATDNAIVRYDTSDGKITQNSGVLIDDSNNITGLSKIETDDHLELTEIAAPATPSTGKVAVYTKTDGKLYIKDDTGTETDCTGAGGSSLPVVDTTSLVEDPVDATKEMRIDVGAVSTATVRVLTMPDQDIDLTPGTGAFATAAEGDLAATAMQDLVDDSTPQLSANLDCNGNNIIIDDTNNIQDDSGNEYIEFSKTASAVNHLDIANAATANDPSITAAGTDANVGVSIQGKGTGNITLGNFVFDGDQTVGAGQDKYVLTYDNSGGLISLEAAGGGGNTYPSATDNSDKTADYTVVSGDVNDNLILGSATAADRKFTLDVSLFSTTDEFITFVNESDYRLQIEVSNTSTMTLSSIHTSIYLWKGESCTISGDTSTNARITARP